MSGSMKVAVGVFGLFCLLAFLFGVFPGGWFDDAADRDTNLLVSTYAAVAVVLTLAVLLVPFRRGETWAWAALWVWPAFFVVHGVWLFPVDFVFAAFGVAALVATRPRRPAMATA